ncbi:OpgC family protein [Chenggangzhangella methanolivorans]|uniref:OpgC domain-containing protein n=1 Tax=Chenggangzhangella methanolivorans TaxID=1437009 RepID=A0A9E6RBT2_9HYPH|nr:OpgC domain-containing protein [Chenggangzhangella methanolivorans]QZO01347.1 OpgC domain-containing protein [Chenggangzhangella methanolivorans]
MTDAPSSKTRADDGEGEYASGVTATAPSRDWRIDFWRGLAIVFIFWNHSVDNVMSWFTTKYYGLSDSAELFVFLSGFAMCGMFLSKFLRRPFMAAPYAVTRAFTLYIHHTAFVVIATLASAYRTYAGSSVMERDLFIRPFFIATETVITKLATLAYLPPLLDILPLYILLTLLLGLLFPVFRGNWKLYAGFAVVVWLFAFFTGATLSSYPDTRLWTFNPFAWQAVFLAGFCACLARDEPWLKRVVAAPATLALAVTIVIVGFIAAAPWATLGLLDWRPLRILTDVADKANASPIRLVHFLSLALIACWLVRRESGLGATRFGRAMILIGRRSLPLFVISTVFAAMSHGVFDWFGRSIPVQIVYALGMAGVLVGLAFVADALGKATKTKKSAPPSAPSAAPEPKRAPVRIEDGPESAKPATAAAP